MKEVTFIRRNIEKWKETEKVVERAASLSPDQLADAYTDLTADLAFAQTHFPTSRITIYLNNLASALHNEIYRNKREKWTRIITFWTQEVPRTMHDARRELLTSFLIFVASALIGVLSAANDPDFVRLILGNGYVDMTLDNIANGEPMAVYNGSSEVPMFLGITLNNRFPISAGQKPGHSLLIIRRLMRWQQKSKRRSIIRDVHRACFVALPVSKGNNPCPLLAFITVDFVVQR